VLGSSEPVWVGWGAPRFQEAGDLLPSGSGRAQPAAKGRGRRERDAEIRALLEAALNKLTEHS
jgi:hypothetical protein